MKRRGVVRSLHPTHSIAAYGKEASLYTQGEENCSSPCAPGGCWDRLRTINAKILLVGVTHIRNTYIKKVKLGDAECILCDAKAVFEVTSKILSQEINCLIDRETIPEEWWNTI